MKSFKFHFRDASKGLRSQFFMLIGEGLVTLLVVLMLGNISFGWFASNKNINAGGMTVSVKADDLTVSYQGYKYDIKERKIVTEDISGLAMPTFDLIFYQQNRYTPVILQMDLAGDTLSDSNTVVLTIDRDKTRPTDVDITKALPPWVSSVVRFTGATDITGTDSAGLPTEQSITGVYENTRDKTGDSLESGVFTGFTEHIDGENKTYTYEKYDTVTLEIHYDPTLLTDNADGRKQLRVYVLLSYDKVLAGQYHRQREFNTDLHAVGYDQPIECDINNIAVSLKTSTEETNP